MALRGGCDRPAVFVDKDGTLVENVPFNVDPRHLRLMPRAAQALSMLRQQGYALVLVSNQSGLGLGRFTRAQWNTLLEALRRRLREQGGVAFDDVLICPHVPGPHGEPVCACRKPQPGLLRLAAGRHGLDLRHSWMVGDTLDDVEAGHCAGCRAILFDSGGETLWRRTLLRTPDRVCTTWKDVVGQILGPVPEASSSWGP